jgi:hypothetical protein
MILSLLWQIWMLLQVQGWQVHARILNNLKKTIYLTNEIINMYGLIVELL